MIIKSKYALVLLYSPFNTQLLLMLFFILSSFLLLIKLRSIWYFCQSSFAFIHQTLIKYDNLGQGKGYAWTNTHTHTQYIYIKEIRYIFSSRRTIVITMTTTKCKFSFSLFMTMKWPHKSNQRSDQCKKKTNTKKFDKIVHITWWNIIALIISLWQWNTSIKGFSEVNMSYTMPTIDDVITKTTTKKKKKRFCLILKSEFICIWYFFETKIVTLFFYVTKNFGWKSNFIMYFFSGFKWFFWSNVLGRN
jgi:hypothetical protein